MKIIVNGAGGRMGKALRTMMEKNGFALAGAVDPFCSEEGILPSLEACQADADIIIDFSNHASTPALTAYAMATKLPLIIATTGHTAQELAMIQAAAEQIPVSDLSTQLIWQAPQRA